jgi:hypothetical protein
MYMTHTLKERGINYTIDEKGCFIPPYKAPRYIRVVRFNQYITLHRLVFYTYYGYFPEVVMHTCDNMHCVNPFHLAPGTFKENSQDMVNKNRQAKGEKNGGGVKLNPQKVIEIKQKLLEGRSLMLLAKEYCVSKKTILNIKKGRKWKHINIL